MSILIDFHTYEIMENATIHNASSEATNHPAEHAIAPLESNFAWEANEAEAQHTLTIDFGETRECDGFSFIHHEVAISPSTGIVIGIHKSSDAINWTAISWVYNSDGSDVPFDDFTSQLIKLRYFTVGGVLASHKARYWRFTLLGMESPNFYAPSDMRISMLWLFRLRQLDRGPSFPINDTEIYPINNLRLPFGKVYRTGHSINPHTLFTRTWMLSDVEYEVLRTLMRECNGMYRPFIMTDVDGTRRLCRFATDEIDEELLDIDLYRITCQFVELPIVQKDGYH